MKMKFPLIAFLVFLSAPFLSLSYTVSQPTVPPPPVLKPAAKLPSIDSVIIFYSRIIDSNHLYTESRIRSFVNKVLVKTTETDTLKAKIIIR